MITDILTRHHQALPTFQFQKSRLQVWFRQFDWMCVGLCLCVVAGLVVSHYLGLIGGDSLPVKCNTNPSHTTNTNNTNTANRQEVSGIQERGKPYHRRTGNCELFCDIRSEVFATTISDYEEFSPPTDQEE